MSTCYHGNGIITTVMESWYHGNISVTTLASMSMGTSTDEQLHLYSSRQFNTEKHKATNCHCATTESNIQRGFHYIQLDRKREQKMRVGHGGGKKMTQNERGMRRHNVHDGESTERVNIGKSRGHRV